MNWIQLKRQPIERINNFDNKVNVNAFEPQKKISYSSFGDAISQ